MKKDLIILTSLALICITICISGCTRSKMITSPKQLNGKKIGVVTDTLYDELVYEIFDKPEVVKYDDPEKMFDGLLNNNIDAFVYDEVVSNYYTASNKYINYLNLEDYKYEAGYIIPKVPEKEYLLNELNEFIHEEKLNNNLIKLQRKWTSDDEKVKTIKNFDKLNGTKGTLKVISSYADAPMAYEENKKPIGYDVDVIYAFCDKYGYKAEIIMCDFEDELAYIDNNEADIGIGNIFITDERKEKYFITDSVLTTYATIGVYLEPSNKNKKIYNKISDLKYKNIGIVEDTIFDNIAIEHLDGCKLKYYSSQDEVYDALLKGEIEGLLYDEPLARYNLKNNNKLKMINQLITYEEYGAIFNKTSKFSQKIKNEYNEFLKEIISTDEYKEIDELWFGDDEDKKIIDYKSLPDINGTVRMCTCTNISEPFVYLKDDKIVGYDIDIMYRFCKKYGYALKIDDIKFKNVFNELENENYDVSACCISITEERKKIVDFSDANYIGGIVCVVRN